MILDNARILSCQTLETFLEANEHRLTLLFLPLLERGGRIDRIVFDDDFYVLIWLIGAVILFKVLMRIIGEI
ncbi:hypothetical protein AWH49_17595 [Domibacillus aminovorans]|uniref:Uncharacterized protein n=2 Tax=Domibacillus aminovorans TaxID=29332 RepID=A0A177L4S1_9BACI|nr:hypothetical protein AWH49_17595 [Domibacillus aminovorans]